MVAVLLAEEGNSSHFLCIFDGDVAVVGELDVLADTCVHNALNLLYLLVGNLLEV